MSKKPLLLVVASPAEMLDRMLSIFRSRATIADVLGAETAERALELSVQHPISAIAVDEMVSDRNGVEILQMLKEIRPEITAMMMVSPSNVKLYEEACSIEKAFCIDRTADLEGMVAKIASHLFEKEVGFRGLLDNLELADILQLICLRRESRQVRITSSTHSGIIFIKEGQVIHARTATQQGERAFYDLFAWKGGDFKLQPLEGDPKRTIQRSWESLLLEAGQMMDEGSLGGTDDIGKREEVVPVNEPEPETTALAADEPQESRPPLEELPGVVIVRKDRKAKEEEKNEDDLPAGRPPVLIAGKPDPKQEKVKSKARTTSLSRSKEETVELQGPERLQKRSKRKTVHSKSQPTRRSRTQRSRKIKTFATWTVITMMAVPTVVMLYLAVPWMTVRNEVEAQVQNVLSGEFVPLALAKSTPVLDESQDVEPLPNAWATLPGICEVRVAPLDIFQKSGTLVAVAAETYDQLDLEENSWVELVTPDGVRMGAMAVRWEGEPELLYVRRTMAMAMEIDETRPYYVKIEPVQLDHSTEDLSQLVFQANRPLAEAYCESWYAAGIGLSVMQQAKLIPGSYAIAEGPEGYQSVRVQVMDRGNPDEVWLSERAREALGITRGSDRVILHPKTDVPVEPVEHVEQVEDGGETELVYEN
jgi:hypothetical protein